MDLEKNQIIVKVNKNKVVNHISESIIYKGLEHCRCISKTKGIT